MRLNAGKVKIGPEENILSLDIPPQLETTVGTGVPFLNDAFGGEGVTPSMTILFTGTPGAGKTTLMLQMVDAMMGTDNIVPLFNTSEENLYQVRKVTKRLSLKHGFIPGQNRLVPEVIDHCKLLQKKNPRKQVVLVLDSLQAHDDGKYGNGTNSMTAVRVTEMVTEWCKETYGIAFIIGQVTKDGVFAGKNEIKHIVEAHAHLFIDMEKKSETYGERIFEVQKNRFGCSGLKYVLAMSSNGIREKATL